MLLHRQYNSVVKSEGKVVAGGRRLRSIQTKTSRYMNSFFPSAIRLLNTNPGFLATRATLISTVCTRGLFSEMSFPDRSAASRVTTDERGGGKSNQLQFTPELSNRQSSSSARFGALSHHSFFSRHNPHPHRVRHIQVRGERGEERRGERGEERRGEEREEEERRGEERGERREERREREEERRGGERRREEERERREGERRGEEFSGALPASFFPGFQSPECVWRGTHLNSTTSCTSSGSFPTTQRTLDVPMARVTDQPEGLFGCRKTQYSAQTGRLIPPSSKSSQRVSRSQQHIYPQPLHDQELMVLELLCQILQTDSLTTVQQWLLLAGQRGNVPPGGPHVMAQRHVLPVSQ
ncbi:Protein TBATA [Takifugu flavidus]|uniref:Protein TBATA n=1 Tax=Takifugu flavidus TaxID=433684 RepID=A0A5C6PSU2_9TELE|nr:Protein TBATA [Takifugu flavidus]